MATLTVDDKTAREIYPTAAPALKAILEDSYPKDFFKGKVTDRIKTFADACKELSIDPNDSVFSGAPADEVAYRKIKVIVQALNEGWTPDWNNGRERKWTPWFYLDTPGFRFRDSYCDVPGSGSTGGSRLCFKSEELASYAGRQFLDLYREFIA
jgi:hypothetical protein